MTTPGERGGRPPRREGPAKGAPHGAREGFVRGERRGGRDNAAGGERRGRGEAPARRPEAPLLPRRVALMTLLDISRGGAYANLALEKRLSGVHLDRRDAALVTRLVYGVTERRMTLDFRIDHTLSSGTDIDPTLREILRMGAYQLFYMDRVPGNAAVDESVRLTRAMGLESLTGLCNAVLRNMIREPRVPWPSADGDPVTYLSVMMSASPELVTLLLEGYTPMEVRQLLTVRPGEDVQVVRPNPLRCDERRLCQLLRDEGIAYEPGRIPGTLRLKGAGDLTRLRAYANGLFSIQGESAVLAARVMEARPGQHVLDACAAPGGKTAVLSADMMDSGRVLAWDLHPHRVELIRAMARRLQLDNVRTMARDASQPRPDLDGTQDAALVDAPCSGTGVIAEKPDLRYRLTREGLEELASTQKKILDSVSRTVRPGGLLVYATCSVLPRENEQQVREFLASHPEFSVCPMGTLLPEDLRPHEGECGLQILPWRDNMDGFYICRMRRGTRA